MLKQKMKNRIVFRMKGIAVADFRRHNEYITVGNIESSIIDMVLAVAGHHDVQLIEIMGMSGRVWEGLIVKIGLYQLMGLKDLVIGEML